MIRGQRGHRICIDDLLIVGTVLDIEGCFFAYARKNRLKIEGFASCIFCTLRVASRLYKRGEHHADL